LAESLFFELVDDEEDEEDEDLGEVEEVEEVEVEEVEEVEEDLESVDLESSFESLVWESKLLTPYPYPFCRNNLL